MTALYTKHKIQKGIFTIFDFCLEFIAEYCASQVCIGERPPRHVWYKVID